jgi:phosphate starvation-inducible PhoH-like protein
LRKLITLHGNENTIRLFGPRDSFLRKLRDVFRVKVVARGHGVSLEGPSSEVETCAAVISDMQERLDHGEIMTDELVLQLVELHREKETAAEESTTHIEGFQAGRVTRPKTAGQERYVRAILEHDIVFCIGPAGTGKTYLAVALALDCMKRGELKRIVRKYIDNDLIEILPMAFVRGRTLDNAFIILDEAQNCTVNQMKTFLTRLGRTAKLVVTGDITQVDLPHGETSGLVDAQHRLQAIPGIAFVRLGMQDIVRHRLVREIVTAYQKEVAPEAEAGRESSSAEPDPQT